MPTIRVIVWDNPLHPVQASTLDRLMARYLQGDQDPLDLAQFAKETGGKVEWG